MGATGVAAPMPSAAAAAPAAIASGAASQRRRGGAADNAGHRRSSAPAARAASALPAWRSTKRSKRAAVVKRKLVASAGSAAVATASVRAAHPRGATARTMSAFLGERQHAVHGCFDQAVVVERAAPARQAVERFEAGAEPIGQCARIGFLRDQALRDQHPVGAGADIGGALRGLGERARARCSARTQSSSGQPSRPRLPGWGGADTRAAVSLNANAITPPSPKGWNFSADTTSELPLVVKPEEGERRH